MSKSGIFMLKLDRHASISYIERKIKILFYLNLIWVEQPHKTGYLHPCRENKDTDQLRSSAAPLFSHMQNVGFLLMKYGVNFFLKQKYCLPMISAHIYMYIPFVHCIKSHSHKKFNANIFSKNTIQSVW